jgi:hypothetical protein
MENSLNVGKIKKSWFRLAKYHMVWFLCIGANVS